jgi:hypothetical protein
VRRRRPPGTASVSGFDVRFDAADGVANDVFARGTGAVGGSFFEFSDAAGDIAAGPGCFPVDDGVSVPVVRCETDFIDPNLVIDLGDGSDRLQTAIGSVSTDVDVLAGPGNDTVKTVGGGFTHLFGDSGADVLNHGGGKWGELHGQAGPDDLTGGRGADLLLGGFGADVLRAVDGVADEVRCGGVFDGDRALVDEDLDFVRECEHVN